MSEITTNLITVRELLAQKYAVDSYQREYKWGKRQIHDLVNDLARAFSSYHEDVHERSDVSKYGKYFLGQIIVSEEDDQYFIVDGQQRLTSLTLMLISLFNSSLSPNQKSTLRTLICSEQYGKQSFNLDVPDRTRILKGLLAGDKFNEDDETRESVRNLIVCYRQIIEEIDVITPEQHPLFSDWLIEKVYLVEFRSSSSNNNAYAIFEAMNDRGLSLTPVEMLKGYLLSKINDTQECKEATEVWKEKVDKLTKLSKTEDANAIKAWLRGRYIAQNSDKKIKDFDDIGAQFHRWARKNERATLGLTCSSEFSKFITKDFAFYTEWYLKLRDATKNFDSSPNLCEVYYIGQHNLNLQYTPLLAALSPNDSESDIRKKLRVVAVYLDIAIHQQIGNNRQVGEVMMRKVILPIITAIRNKPANEIAALLKAQLQKDNKDDDIKSTLAHEFAQHGTNKQRIHRILARITDYVATEAGESSHYTDYFAAGKNDRFEIEHIWRNQFDGDRKKEFLHAEHDFQGARNKIGGLLLLPDKDNASYGDKPYPKKYPHYIKQNLLAQSLHEICYKNNPGFLKFVENSKLPFKHYTEFTKDALEERQQLYLQIADKIWNPERLLDAASQ